MRTHEVSARFTSIALVLAICLLIGAGCGQGSASYKNPTKEPGAPISQEKQLTMDDLLYSEYVSEMRISPDGRRLAWVKKGNTRGQDLASSNLFVTNLSDLSTVQLTNLWVSMWGPVSSATRSRGHISARTRVCSSTRRRTRSTTPARSRLPRSCSRVTLM